jgi:hypothetical protein
MDFAAAEWQSSLMACFDVPEGSSAYAETAHADVRKLKSFGVTIQGIFDS